MADLEQATDHYLRARVVHSAVERVLAQGRKVHGMATAKERFDQAEWSTIGNEATTMHAMLIDLLRQHDHHALLDPEDDKDELRALDRIKRVAQVSGLFEPEAFMGNLQIVALLEAKASAQVRSALKDLTDLQLAWMPLD